MKTDTCRWCGKPHHPTKPQCDCGLYAHKRVLGQKGGSHVAKAESGGSLRAGLRR